MSNNVFQKIVGLSDQPQEEIISQEELDAQNPVYEPAFVPANIPAPLLRGTLGAKIGWRESGSEKGRGVYAREDIPKGTAIEVAPVIIVAEKDIPDDGGAPDGYLLDWDPDEKGQEHCMPLGYMMLYNHSRESNIYLENDYEEMSVTSYASRDIKAGEELLWDYSCDIWFDEA